MPKNNNPKDEYEDAMAARGLEQITNKSTVPEAPEPVIGDEHERRVNKTVLNQAKEGGPQAPETLTGETLKDKAAGVALKQLQDRQGEQQEEAISVETGISVGDKGIPVDWPTGESNISVQQEVKPGSAEEQG